MNLRTQPKKAACIKFATVCLASISLASCSYMQPYVYPTLQSGCFKEGKQESCMKLPAVKDAMAQISTDAEAVRKKLEAATWTSRSLDLLTFGLITTFAVKGMHGTSDSSSAKNVALGAGATYTANSLFLPRTVESIYLQANTDLTCIGGRGSALFAAYDQAHGELNSEETKSLRSNLNSCSPVTEDEGKVVQAVKDSVAVSDAMLARVEASQGQLASRMSTAGRDVLTRMNQQVMGQAPSKEAILGAGGSASTIASALMPAKAGEDSGGANKAPPLDKTPCPNADALQVVKSKIDGVAASLAQQMNGIGDLPGACLAPATVPVVVLAVSQQDVTLSPGGNAVNIVVTGGRAPIPEPNWIGEVPDPKVLTKEWSPATGVLRVFEPTAGIDKTFQLRVVDSSVVQSAVVVRITTTKAK